MGQWTVQPLNQNTSELSGGDFDTYGGGTHRVSLWSEHKTKTPCGCRQLL
ncbi:hypothetical protein H6G83_11820 [Anabaena azotica FACHB-119]|uniref:Uncharacterized protein n=1 Tax=Anabaena azotica FACHB-119 TaxID=947527 RepID=A0ABR8D6B9_9NOST|nr:hypothetical protein [Anabaena azotica FACHB-119]